MDLERLAVVAAVILVAMAASFFIRRRGVDPPTQPRWSVPSQIDRSDFARADTPWIVVVFTSKTCDACEPTMVKAKALASAEVTVVEIEVGAYPDLHRRYDIDAVPTLVVADSDGVVRTSFVGPPPAGDLWAAVAGLRDMT